MYCIHILSASSSMKGSAPHCISSVHQTSTEGSADIGYWILSADIAPTFIWQALTRARCGADGRDVRARCSDSHMRDKHTATSDSVGAPIRAYATLCLAQVSTYQMTVISTEPTVTFCFLPSHTPSHRVNIQHRSNRNNPASILCYNGAEPPEPVIFGRLFKRPVKEFCS